MFICTVKSTAVAEPARMSPLQWNPRKFTDWASEPAKMSPSWPIRTQVLYIFILMRGGGRSDIGNFFPKNQVLEGVRLCPETFMAASACLDIRFVRNKSYADLWIHNKEVRKWLCEEAGQCGVGWWERNPTALSRWESRMFWWQSPGTGWASMTAST